MDDIFNSNFVIQTGATVKDALEAITDNQRGSIVIIDEDKKLLGVISDGDIRRGLLKEMTILAPVEDMANLNPIVLVESGSLREESKKIFSDKPAVNLIPIVSSDNILVDVIIRSPEVRT